MVRLVALLLALLLPLQFAWGVAAAYCGHESGVQTSAHVGHHAHAHHADEAAKKHAEKPAGAKLAVDNDCSACHATCSVMPPAVSPCLQGRALSDRPALLTADAHASAPARAPDRPQWRRLA